jgi:hypothetical protein
MLEMPANGGLLQIGSRSPSSEFDHFQSQIADNLRRIFEIFPFCGDGDRRPGSIRHWVVELAVQLAKFSALAAGKLVDVEMKRTLSYLFIRRQSG